MKSIHSEGGPFIMIERSYASKWGGVMHKKFMSDVRHGESDYEALCVVLERPEFDRKGLAAIQVDAGEALILGMPMEAAVLFNDHDHACVVQVYNAELDWSFNCLDRSVANPRGGHISCFADIKLSAGDLVLFDSAYDYLNHEKDELSLTLTGDVLRAEYFLCQPDSKTLIGVMNLHSYSL